MIGRGLPEPARTGPANERAFRPRKPGRFDISPPGCHRVDPREPIEEGQVGDWVLATDPETGQTGPRLVLDLITGDGDKSLVEITADTGGRQGRATGAVIATDGHPFWVPELRKWLTAAELRAGMLLQTSAGSYVRIRAIKKWTAVEQVHNLSIASLNTYYVGVSAISILIHNSGGCRPPGAKSDWSSRTADNGKGTVWQAPDSSGNANSMRLMQPTSRYPHGYVRFYNQHGQPMGLDGKPGPNSVTHIPIDPNGSYPLPVGW